MGPLIVPCVATTTNRHTYQICACHLGIRQALWADQNVVLLFIHTHLPQKYQSQFSDSIGVGTPETQTQKVEFFT